MRRPVQKKHARHKIWRCTRAPQRAVEDKSSLLDCTPSAKPAESGGHFSIIFSGFTPIMPLIFPMHYLIMKCNISRYRRKAVLSMQETKELNSTEDPNMRREASPGQGAGNRRKRRPHIKRSGLFAVLGISFGAALLLYFLIGFYYQKVFLPATTVNGIAVSGLTPEQVQDLLNTNAAEYVLTIIEDGDQTEQISGSSIGLYAKNDNSLQDILGQQNILTWAFQIFQEKAYLLDMEYDEERLSSAINGLSCMNRKNWVSPENAYIKYEKGSGYRIVPEIPGNEILTDNLFDAVRMAIDRLDSDLSLRDAGVYRLPETLSDSADLAEQFSLLEPYSDMTVTYQFGSQTEVLDSDTLSDWVSLDKNGTLRIDEEAAAEFVKGLAKKYNTAYSPKTLETSYGETVTIKGGFYGWQIDRETETENLLAIIRGGKSVTTEPAYLLRAASHDELDYGDTYVEINLTAQHLFYYKDGELLIESDFVSGNPSKGNATPAGAYAITYTERNATLKGQNYRTPVSYWMPFNGNIGMHDSSWRSSFGGVIYQTNGSHGCINLPPSVAKVIFENIEKGIPVLCYHLGGTEQNPDDLSDEQIAAENDPAESQEPSAGDIPAEGQPAVPEEGAPVDGQPAAPEGNPPAGGESPAPEGSTPADGQSAAPEGGAPADGTAPLPPAEGAIPADTAPAPAE